MSNNISRAEDKIWRHEIQNTQYEIQIKNTILDRGGGKGWMSKNISRAEDKIWRHEIQNVRYEKIQSSEIQY